MVQVEYMKKSIKRQIKSLLPVMPEWLWHRVERFLEERLQPQSLEVLRMQRYAYHLLEHFDEECSKIAENRKCMVVEVGDYGYTYFNIAYLNNVLALIFYALYQGYVPLIQINQENPQYNKWDWYFVQPHVVMGINIDGFDKVSCDIKNHPYRPSMNMVHDSRGQDFRFWSFMFRKFVVVNNTTEAYVNQEILQLGNPNKYLGVLLRGTDYIKLKPKGHPIQPEPQEVVDKTAQMIAIGGYSGVYVATEEKRLFDMVSAAVGKEITLENKRQYYDAEYYQSGVDLIGKVHFQRENDNYWKGIEYLSSLIILSKCKTLVAGNCGGTLFAMLMADYQNPYVFDYGVY